jgi:hypothetical protein
MKASPKKNLRVGGVMYILASCLAAGAAFLYARQSKPGLATIWAAIAVSSASLAAFLLRKSRLQ